MDEHVVAAVIADNEAESLLRIEELHDPFSLANDLRRHSATAAAAETAATAAAEAAAIAAPKAATVAESAATAAASEPAALFESAAVAAVAFLEEPVALVSSATATVALTPSVETPAR
jgi:hypothetical protein